MEPHWSSQRWSSILWDTLQSLHLKNIHKESNDENKRPQTAPCPLLHSPLPCHVGAAATAFTSCVSWEGNPALSHLAFLICVLAQQWYVAPRLAVSELTE